MRSRKALVGVGLSLAALVAAAFVGTTILVPRTITHATAAGTTGTITSRRPSVLPASLLLNGSVIDMGNAASGTITIRIGSNVTTTSVTLPNYSVSIQPAQLDDMVSIEIETLGYKYAAILGSYRKLAQHAGTDTQLTLAELDRLRLSPISTALYFFLKRDLGGRLPVTDVEHEQMIRSVPGGDVGIAAAVLKYFDSEISALPNGYATGYALLENQAVYSDYLAEHPYVLNARVAYLNSTPSIPMLTDNVGHTVLLAGPLFRGDATLFGPNVQILTPSPAGYAVHAGSSRRDASFTRQLVSGDLLLTPQNPVHSEQFVLREDGTLLVLERRDLIQSTYRRQFLGDLYSLWVEVKEEYVSYPLNPEIPSAQEANAIFWSVSPLDRRTTIPVQLVGDRALPVFCKQGPPFSLASCEFVQHTIMANGTGSTSNGGFKVDSGLQPRASFETENFTWRSSMRGSFQFDYPSGSVTYWGIDGGDNASDLLVYVASAHDGTARLSLAGSTAMIHSDATAGFDEITPDGTWRYASFEQYKPPYAYNIDNFPSTERFNLSTDGTGVQTTRSQIPQFSFYDFDYRFGWQLLDGGLYQTRYRGNISTGITGTYYFSSCAQAAARGATQCAPFRVRYFRPLARSGNRLYGIEDVYLQTSFNDYEAPFEFTRASRATYYEKL